MPPRRERQFNTPVLASSPKFASSPNIASSNELISEDMFLVGGVQTSFTDGKSQEGKIDVTTNFDEDVTLSSPEAFDPYLSNNYKDLYTNIEVENWCNINLFE